KISIWIGLFIWALSVLWAQSPPTDEPFSASDRADLLRAVDTRNRNVVRDHAWRLFAALTRPSGNQQVPLFLTWYSKEQAFEENPKPGSFSLEYSDKLQAYGLLSDPNSNKVNDPPLSSVYFNQAVVDHLHYGRKWPSKPEMAFLAKIPQKDYKLRCVNQL